MLLQPTVDGAPALEYWKGEILTLHRLDSVRSQIIAFAILAALVPSLIISLIAYQQSRLSLLGRVTQELVTTSLQVARQTDLWLKDRLSDLKVFAGSSVVSDTIARQSQAGRLADYLSSVRGRFADYEEIQLVDAKGKLIASTSSRNSARRLPKTMDVSSDASSNLVGEPFWDEKSGKVLVILGVPVMRGDGRVSGVLVAYVNFAGLRKDLRDFLAESKGRVYLVTESGVVIVDSADDSAGQKVLTLEPKVTERLRAAAGQVVGHQDVNGIHVLASAQRLSQASWMAVADRSAADAYRMATELRGQAFAVIGFLLAIIAVVAYWLASLIARPLTRLSDAAAKVSAGDLSVGLPEGGRGEVGYLTQAFNTMIESLRKSRDELERLSTTDALTGLGNRRHLMDQLSQEIERAKRSGQPFSILLMDVDHFKKYNDNYGHQAGDEVLTRVGTVLQNSIRSYDCAARYGGEEFLIMLGATPLDRAQEFAERIRKQIRQEQIEGGPMTVSIGVAEFPAQGDSAKAIIAQADAALYEAKRAGRDRVVCASGKRDKAK